MNRFVVVLVVSSIALVSCEAPGGYNYTPRGGGGGGGYSGGGSGGDNFIAVPVGGQTYEGQNVDYSLLEKVKQAILKDEQSSGGGGGGGYSSGGSGGYPSSSYGAPSSSYGAPSSSYGVPSGYSSKVVDLSFEGVKPALQVAEYLSQSSGGGGGYPSSSYGAPSSSYGAPSSY